MKTKTKKVKYPKKIHLSKKAFYLFDSKGRLFGEYKTEKEAERDVSGPIFFKGYAIVEVKLTRIRTLRRNYFR